MTAVKEAPRTGIGTEQAKEAVLASFNPSHIVALEQGCIRIPSDTFAEGPLADYFASYMERIGLDVAMIEVVNPFDSTKT